MKMFEKEVTDNFDPALPELSMLFDFPTTDKSQSEKTEMELLVDKISEISRQGYAFLKENDTKNAVIEFNKILELDETNNYALVGLGDAARKNKNPQSAIAYYDKCLEHYPNNNYALFGIADAYKSLGDYQQAIFYWIKYLDSDPHNITVITRIADAQRKSGNFDESKKLYTQVLTLSERNTYALIGLGHLYYDFKKYREALAYWQKAIEGQSDVDIRIMTSIGNCYRKLKNFNSALPYFISAVGKDSNNFYALFGLADCYRGLNQHSTSIIYWKKMLELDSKNKVILTRLGDAYRNVSDFEQAKIYYEKALAIAYDSYALLGLAILKKQQGLYAQAISDLKGLLATDKKNYRIYLELAKCYVTTGEKEKAMATLDAFKQFGIRNNEIASLYNQLTVM